jgi:hypothetical protein
VSVSRWSAGETEASVDVFVGHGGSGFPAHLGWLDEIRHAGFRPRRVVGISTGSITAAVIALGVPTSEAIGHAARGLLSGLDDYPPPGPLSLAAYRGLHTWDRTRSFLSGMFGAAELGDSLLEGWGAWVFSLGRGHPIFVSSRRNPKVRVVDLLCAATAFPWHARAQRVPGMTGRWWSAALSSNAWMDAFGISPRRTIGVVVHPRSVVAPVISPVDALLAASSTAYCAAARVKIPRRHWLSTSIVRVTEDPFAFQLSRDAFEVTLEAGRRAGREWVERDSAANDTLD